MTDDQPFQFENVPDSIRNTLVDEVLAHDQVAATIARHAATVDEIHDLAGTVTAMVVDGACMFSPAGPWFVHPAAVDLQLLRYAVHGAFSMDEVTVVADIGCTVAVVLPECAETAGLAQPEFPIPPPPVAREHAEAMLEMTHEIAVRIGTVIMAVEEEFGVSADDEPRRLDEGWASNLVDAMTGDGVDPTDSDAVAEWMARFNRLTFEERSDILDGVDGDHP